jgi:prepilin-type N-terminal cleavage/methylation domain-containing protein
MRVVYKMRKDKAMTIIELLVVLALLASISTTLFINFDNIATVHKDITKEAITYTNVHSIFNIVSQKDSMLMIPKAFINQSPNEIKVLYDPSEPDKMNIDQNAVKNWDSYNRKTVDNGNGDIFWSKLDSSKLYPKFIISNSKLYDSRDSSTKLLLGDDFKNPKSFTFYVNDDLSPAGFQTGDTNYSSSEPANYRKWLLLFSSTQTMTHNVSKTLPIVANSESKYPRVIYFKNINTWNGMWGWIIWIVNWLFSGSWWQWTGCHFGWWGMMGHHLGWCIGVGNPHHP